MEKRTRVAVVVLGDIGRSPRMQYHALSLAREAHFEVDIVAAGGSEPHTAVLMNEHIHIHEMASVRLSGLSKISTAIALLIKAIVQFVLLIWYLCFKIPHPDAFLVQNPPSVPTLAAVKLASWLGRCGFVIDWHNFGYTLLGMSHGRNRVIVKLYCCFEKYFGKTADGSLCVTKAMQHELEQNWGVKASVLYDQPSEFFHPASLKEMHELFCRLHRSICDPHGFNDFVISGNDSLNVGVRDPSCTTFSTKDTDNVFLKANRPALVVSSTSWTPDEDFSLLLEAAVFYDRRVAAVLDEGDSIDEKKLWIDMNNGKQYLYPRLLFIITGKGPEKKNYEEKIKKLKLRRVAFRTMWLSAEDYPVLLGSADLGISLHTSSSGLDLPMKVVDMFGCGVPVCAVSYSCIEELVKNGENGLLFSSSSELADQLMMLFKGFPDNCDKLKALRGGALATGSSSAWSTEWEKQALPVIHEVISRKRRSNRR
ncbi:hypothetical protein HPP92_025666 [Vanilla planifolia]|uniref:Beta-1,4-mannosyltransferase n=1 Tax=Vanilla planifolia TaxID=51239 RepID=A0A835PK05_VANPL|nr:hypothetical protein HPP92_025666 [Vanilla planifolia]